ncbi:MAG TPA: hypothetical protein VFP62_13840 [Burkholderiales bacterium]|jgi:hypothetical protein|nr:hypothetical protein [Burkholderiales bacterium]
MDTARQDLDPLEDAGHFAGLLSGARGAAEVVAAVRDYLAAWPQARVVQIQRLDGGWAPFDARQQPMPLHRPTDVHRIRDAVHAQCASLRAASVTAAPELLELDLFLSMACAKLADIEPAMAPQHPGSAERQPESRAHR